MTSTHETIATALGILTAPSDDVRAAQRTLGLDLTAVDADGTIRWIDVRPDYTTRTEPADVLAAADRTLV